MVAKDEDDTAMQRRLDFVLGDFDIALFEWRRGLPGPAYCSATVANILPDLVTLEAAQWSREYLLSLCDPNCVDTVANELDWIWDGSSSNATFEARLRHPLTKLGYVDLMISVKVFERDPEDGKPAAALVTLTDFTDQKGGGEVKYSHYKKLVNDAPLGVVILDESEPDRIAYANDAIARLLSAPELGKTVSRHDLRGKSLRRFILKEDREVLFSKLPVARRVAPALDLRFIRLDGSTLDVRVSLSRNRWLLAGRVEIRGLFLFVTDTSGLKQEQRELQRRTEEMERFIYMVSHDLRTPLITISSFAGLLEKEAREKNSPRFVQDLARIGRASRRLHGLLNGLLELSRIGRQEMAKEVVSLCLEAGHVRDGLKAALEKQRVSLRIDPRLPHVLAVRPRIVQVLQNLVENSIKFMGDQTSPMIEIGTEKRDGEVRLYVRDNGSGIAPGQTEKVFDMFVRLNTKREDGHGVGLAVVKRIVEWHGGRIWVENNGESTDGNAARGCTFYFTLPIVRPKSRSGKDENRRKTLEAL